MGTIAYPPSRSGRVGGLSVGRHGGCPPRPLGERTPWGAAGMRSGRRLGCWWWAITGILPQQNEKAVSIEA